MHILNILVYNDHPVQSPGIDHGAHPEQHAEGLQAGQLYMAVCFWYIVKRDLSGVPYYTILYTIYIVIVYILY